MGAATLGTIIVGVTALTALLLFWTLYEYAALPISYGCGTSLVMSSAAAFLAAWVLMIAVVGGWRFAGRHGIAPMFFRVAFGVALGLWCAATCVGVRFAI